MKTSAVLASMLFGSLAVAAPFDKRALAIKTEIVTETLVVYTTVWDDEVVPEATTTPAGYFYEQPKPSSAAAQPTPAAPSPQPEKPKVSSAAPAPAPQAPAPSAAPAPSPSPSPAPAAVEQPKPAESSKPAEQPSPAPAPSPSPSPSPAPSNPSGGAASSGASYQGVDMTIYNNNGGYGACGTKLYDTDMIVALSQGLWGSSTYDKMTGNPTNPNCGQKIKIEYGGNSVEATIMDLCPGCTGKNDIDVSLAVWNKLTNNAAWGREKASWSKIN